MLTPAELDGSYLRNGPNPIGAQDPDAYHWFTGDGMVHGLRLRDGEALWDVATEWERQHYIDSQRDMPGLMAPFPGSPRRRRSSPSASAIRFSPICEASAASTTGTEAGATEAGTEAWAKARTESAARLPHRVAIAKR